MNGLTELGAFIAAFLGVLKFVADSQGNFRRAIRETLELSALFEHDEELAKRFRTRASTLASEYLEERERAPYPRHVTAIASLIVIGLFLAIEPRLEQEIGPAKDLAEGLARQLITGLLAGGAVLIARSPIHWILTNVRRAFGRRARGASRGKLIKSASQAET